MKIKIKLFEGGFEIREVPADFADWKFEDQQTLIDAEFKHRWDEWEPA